MTDLDALYVDPPAPASTRRPPPSCWRSPTTSLLAGQHHSEWIGCRPFSRRTSPTLDRPGRAGPRRHVVRAARRRHRRAGVRAAAGGVPQLPPRRAPVRRLGRRPGPALAVRHRRGPPLAGLGRVQRPGRRRGRRPGAAGRGLPPAPRRRARRPDARRRRRRWSRHRGQSTGSCRPPTPSGSPSSVSPTPWPTARSGRRPRSCSDTGGRSSRRHSDRSCGQPSTVPSSSRGPAAVSTSTPCTPGSTRSSASTRLPGGDHQSLGGSCWTAQPLPSGVGEHHERSRGEQRASAPTAGPPARDGRPGRPRHELSAGRWGWRCRPRGPERADRGDPTGEQVDAGTGSSRRRGWRSSPGAAGPVVVP